MVKYVYRKTISFWSRLFAVFISFFSFSSPSRSATFRAGTSSNLNSISSSYNNILGKISALENKIKVLKSSGGSDSLSSLQAEIEELRKQANSINSSVSSLRSQIDTIIKVVPVIEASSYNSF